ncbi:MAG: tyrosine-protein phosphatase [Bacteroidota bacterium]
MFGLFRKKTSRADYGTLGVDMHSHILPGIDDGAPDVETSLQLIRNLLDMGYRQFIATPHIYPEIHPNNRETIAHALATLRTALREAGMNVQVDAAAEYMIDDAFDSTLQQGNLLTLPGNRVLVEMSTMSVPPNLDQSLFQLQLDGYQPVIAHPERYLFVGKSRARFHDWHDRGYELQINLLSVTGYYSPVVKENALYLLKNNLVHFAGTDAHHHRHTELLGMALKDPNMQRCLEQAQWLNSTLA